MTADGTILAGTKGGLLIGLGPDGTERFLVPAPGPLDFLAMGPQATIVAGSSDGHLYVFGE